MLFVQVMTMWMLAYVIHPQWIMAIGLELIVGIERWVLSHVLELFKMRSARLRPESKICSIYYAGNLEQAPGQKHFCTMQRAAECSWGGAIPYSP